MGNEMKKITIQAFAFMINRKLKPGMRLDVSQSQMLLRTGHEISEFVFHEARSTAQILRDNLMAGHTMEICSEMNMVIFRSQVINWIHK